MTATAIFAFVGCKNETKDTDRLDTTDDIVVVDNTDDNNMRSTDDQNEMRDRTLSVTMQPKSGSTAKGEVVFTEKNGKVKMEANFTGLKPGPHAIHLHETADCSSDDGTSTGGHWNPTNKNHGKWGASDGYHKGDIGNFDADSDGKGSISMETDEWCIGCDDKNKNIVGTGVIVHEGTDDFKSQPAGDAGGRVACGEVNE